MDTKSDRISIPIWVVAQVLRSSITVRMAALAVCFCCIARLNAAPQDPTIKPLLTRQLQFQSCYVKEDADLAWKIRLSGNMPDGPGLFVIVYNETGDIVHRAAVPCGEHTAENPYVITIPADGKIQQYVVKLLGQEDNLRNLTLPLTDLSHEVYGDGSWYSFGQGKSGDRRIVAFQAPADGSVMKFSGYKGDYRILDDLGAVVADSKDKVPLDPNGRNAQPKVKMDLTLPPGKTFWLEPYGVQYLASETNLYLTFNPERWFEPNLAWDLKSRPWWKGLVTNE